MTVHFDVIILGGGPGGYACAIKASQLGLKVACVDKRETLGGTCLNVGCIPSKSLLHASKLYKDAKEHFGDWGIESPDVKVNLKTMLAKKDQVVNELTQGISLLFKKNKISHYHGTGKIVSSNEVEVSSKNGTILLKGKSIVIATGSSNRTIPGISIDEERIISSTGALCLPKIPKRLVVMGGGYIGLELGSVWSRLGSKVTVIEYANTIVPALDNEVGKELLKSLKKQGIDFLLGTKVCSVDKKAHSLTVHLENVHTKDKTSLETDILLVSIGRTPQTEEVWNKEISILKTSQGFIEVNDRFETNIPNLYAIGDVIPGPMLAHKAEEEGIALAEILVGQKGHVNYEAIPSVIYTSPEVASVGKTEEQLQQSQISYKVGKFPFSANSRSKAVGKTTGFVKVLAHANTDRILGIHIIGEDAGTLISEAVLALEYKASSEDIARTCHPHPTTSEALKEASLGSFFKTIHS